MQEKPEKGDIVLMPFPYTDMSGAKTRPALVLSGQELGGDDIILCPISSQKSGNHETEISNNDLESGELPVVSYVRFSKLITVDKRIIRRSVSKLSNAKLKQIIYAIKLLF